MRSATTRSFFLILGLLLLVGGLPGLARAQGATPSAPGGSICDPPSPNATNPGEVSGEGLFVTPLNQSDPSMTPPSVRVFQALFAVQYAAVPKCENPEATIAFVQSGEFALDTGGNGPVYIDPPRDTPVRLMELVDPVAGYYQDVSPPTFLENPDGSACAAACAVPTGGIVRVMPGSTVYSPHGSRCLWCLMTTLPGNLFVTAVRSNSAMVTEPFLWTQFDFASNPKVIDELYGGSSAGTPVANQWWFNPPTNCGRGGG